MIWGNDSVFECVDHDSEVSILWKMIFNDNQNNVNVELYNTCNVCSLPYGTVYLCYICYATYYIYGQVHMRRRL